MASTSAIELANRIVNDCLHHEAWPVRDLDALIERSLDEQDTFFSSAATKALFTIVVERLSDLFEPALCEVYSRLFAHVIERALPEYRAEDLVLRYRRISQAKRFIGGEVKRVFILSRVTLGADVAVTSVLLAGAKERFPGSEICFIGPEKNAALFESDSRITPIPLSYSRAGSLVERLQAAAELRSILDEPGCIVIDPDTRLTQLGLLPVCDDSRYYFFESRAYGGTLPLALSDLVSDWFAEVFGVPGILPYVAPRVQQRQADVCVSWGVGENQDKRIDEDFEAAVLAHLLGKGLKVFLDCGAGGEETDRINRLSSRLNSPQLLLHQGTYSSFASQIVQSLLYVGYDSVGQHVASAAQVPLLSVFAGYPSERMMTRWRPKGKACVVFPVSEENRSSALTFCLPAIDGLLGL